MERTYGRLINFDQKHRLYNIKPVLLVAGFSMNLPQSVNWKCPIVVDQGSEGSCVGHGWVNVLASGPQSIPDMDHETAVVLYHDAQKLDPWEGGAYPGATPFYEGTTVSSGGKACMANGYIGGFCWSFEFFDFLVGVAHFSPAAIGVNWKAGMQNTDDNGFIHYDGDTMGGHCVCIDQLEIKDPYNINYETDYAAGPNSWGDDWGNSGRFRISLGDLEKALKDNGEACFPLAKRQQPLIRPW